LARIKEYDDLFDPIDKHFSYGTAGFRTLGTHLERVIYRVGLMVGIRAKIIRLGGIMITASHNPKEDNGVKIIERDGSMLVAEWESVAEEFANSKDIA
jgi:phosphoacetylglucosamine mutase